MGELRSTQVLIENKFKKEGVLNLLAEEDSSDFQTKIQAVKLRISKQEANLIKIRYTVEEYNQKMLEHCKNKGQCFLCKQLLEKKNMDTVKESVDKYNDICRQHIQDCENKLQVTKNEKIQLKKYKQEYLEYHKSKKEEQQLHTSLYGIDKSGGKILELDRVQSKATELGKKLSTLKSQLSVLSELESAIQSIDQKSDSLQKINDDLN